MSLTKKILYGFWIAVLVGIVAFTSVAIYKFIDSEKYKRTDDKLYTFSELSGITAESKISCIEYIHLPKEKWDLVGAPLATYYYNTEEIEKFKQGLLEMQFVETYEDIGDEKQTLVITFASGADMSIYTSEYTFRFSEHGKTYRAVGATNFYEIAGGGRR